VNLKVPFGRQPPPEAVVAWGARAIYSIRSGRARQVKRTVAGRTRRVFVQESIVNIDLLWDRQRFAGDEPAILAFKKVVDEKLLPALRIRCAERGLPTNSHDVVEIKTDDGCTMEASPQGSYGYLYIGAWRVPA